MRLNDHAKLGFFAARISFLFITPKIQYSQPSKAFKICSNISMLHIIPG